MTKLTILVTLAGLVGCLDSRSVLCGSGFVCPEGTTCSHLTTPDQDVCATSEQIAACVGLAEGDACTFAEAPPSWCHDGVCVATVCGNGRLDLGEVCDDGNTESGDGTCSGDCASTEACGNGIVDPLGRDTAGNSVLNEACDDGNRISADGCSSTCKTERLRWSQVGQPPVPNEASSIAYDAVRKRVVMFGGEISITYGNTDNHVPTNRMYEWNGTDWARVPTVSAPPARRNAGMAYDSARRKIVLFGGRQVETDFAGSADLWEWDGEHWALRTVPAGPAARSQFGLVYDAARKKIVLFGGAGGTDDVPTVFGDTWEWDGTTWTQVTGGMQPPARFGHVMAYDPVRGVTVMAGGYDSTTTAPTYHRDTWEYNGSWQRVNTTTPSDLDYGSSMAFDPSTGRMITFGGQVSPYAPKNLPVGAASVSTRTLAFANGTWAPLTPTQPGVRHSAAMVTDVARGQIVLFGGDPDFANNRYADTWRWNGTTWLAVTPFVPPTLQYAATAHDPLHGVTWLFGGQTWSPSVVATNYLWSFDGTTWKQHTAPGPTARVAASVAYDPVLAKLIVFGGATLDSSGRLVPTTGETWTFDGTTWASSTPTMSPSPRSGATAYFDPNRGRVVLYGGSGASYLAQGGMWEWTGTAWQPIAAEMPGNRGFASSAFDAARNEGVMWAGFTVNGSPTVYTDTWTFDGAGWTSAAAANAMPRRFFTDVAYDSAGRRVMLFGGTTLGNSAFGDTWQWTGAEWQPVLTTESPGSRGTHVMFEANDGRGVLVFGGATELDGGGTKYADTWRLRYENDESGEQCLLTVDDDGDGLQGCADPDCWAYCAPMCPPGATCDSTAPRCGDGTCNNALESCRNCPADCATCAAVCGDGVCDAPETTTSCRGDCGP